MYINLFEDHIKMTSSFKILSALCAMMNLLILIPTVNNAKWSTSVMSTATPAVSYEQSTFREQ